MTTLREIAEKKQERPAQSQNHRPGVTSKMQPHPEDKMSYYEGSGKLEGKIALITGGDSGIGRAVAIAYAKEGADVSIAYLEEDEDAEETKSIIESLGRKALLCKGDVGNEEECIGIVGKTISEFGSLDILVNNAAEQHPQESIKDITEEQLEKTFRTNVYSIFFMTKAALDYLAPGSSIINTASITAYQGSPKLLDYSSTKGAIVAFTRSLSQGLIEKNIRVNAVAPGPIWTPLIPSTFSPDEVRKFGEDTPMKRAGQPDEVAPTYVYLASDDSTYVTGQTIHVNGGTVVNG